MQYIDEFRNRDLIFRIADNIREISTHDVTLMEVCGGHTMAIHKFGLKELLPESIRLISGPGCPVCVSGTGFIDTLITLSRLHGVIIATYGDLIRVPGSFSSLEKEKMEGKDVHMVYSVLDALDIASDNSGKTVVFPGIGFETTAPATAAAIIRAEKNGVSNFKVLSAHKLMPPVMEALIDEGVRINGYIAPGHVSAITGLGMYSPIPEKYKVGVVISGFEPLDIMQSIQMLVTQFETGNPSVENQYKRVVKPEGNPVARKMMETVFIPGDDSWRGLGTIKNSGLKIRDDFSRFDALKEFDLPLMEDKEPSGCICGEVLKGMKTPLDCSLFGEKCTPMKPVGACMVSTEGTCAAWFRFNTEKKYG
jgi:hydrogenase expression/formation protein HypD